MKFYDVENLPVVVFDDFFSKNACEKIWQELCFLNNEPNKMLSFDKTASAFDVDESGEKIVLKKNRGIFLHDAYRDPSISNIYVATRKLYFKSTVEKLKTQNYFFRYLQFIDLESILVQYYEDSDNYKFHLDESLLTFVYWIYDEPKKFDGGNLTFENGLKVECKYNRGILFPSVLYHQVDEVFMKENEKNQGYGRYSITQLLTVSGYSREKITGSFLCQ